MIVRGREEIEGSEADVSGEGWRSLRLLLKRDGMGFSLHDSVIEAGSDLTIWYKNHLEACYCIEGEGEIENLDSGEVFALGPGTLYACDRHDRHRFRTKTRLRLICVFTPACTGAETHDADGSYPLL